MYDTNDITGVNLETTSFSQFTIVFTGFLNTGTTIKRRQTLVINGAARQLSNANFQGAVWVDATNGITGTVFPIGTPGNPVNNLVDARTIATTIGVRRYNIYQGFFTLTVPHDNWTFQGLAAPQGSSIDVNSQSVINTQFDTITVTGILGTNSIIGVINGIANALQNFNGIITQSAIGGTFTFAANTQPTFAFCTVLASITSPVFNAQNNANIILAVRFFTGEITLQNLTNTSSAVLEFEAGTFFLDNTSEGNVVTVRGIVVVTDTSTNKADVIGVIDPSTFVTTIAGAVWDQLVSTHIILGSFGNRVGKKLLDLGRFIALR